MIHRTAKVVPICDFDERFPKMPSYLRRAAIQRALGVLSSHYTRYAQWKAGGCKGKAPKLNTKCHDIPCFYRTDMFQETDNPTVIRLKVYHNNDWVWMDFDLKKTDVQYIKRHCAQREKSAPTLENRHGKWFLRFAFTQKVQLNCENVFHQRICAVDLGLNTDAVCTVMEPDGTILARKFVNFPCDKDYLGKVLGRISRFQREHGSKNVAGLWQYAQRLNDELSCKIAAGIVDVAILYSCTTIVFEFLEFKGKIRGSKKQRIALWRKQGIQKTTARKAHENGIRISRVCAWNTSSLAYDGSGKVTRGKEAGFSTSALCRFQNKKVYNCDLNASYNIGARYYCREILKTLPETERSQVEADDPVYGRRTSCTYADLIQLWDVLLARSQEQDAQVSSVTAGV